MGERNIGEGLTAREYDWRETLPSIAVIETAATLEGVDPRDLPQLSEYIDPDSLDAVIVSGDDVAISFSAYGYTIKIVNSTVIVRNH